VLAEKETVLVVDDEASVRRLLRTTLTGEGYSCDEAGNGEEALKALAGRSYSLVILDVKMPHMSGIEALPLIRGSYPDTAVIMATANIDVTTAVQCMAQGAYNYITKPFNLDEVIISVNRALEKRRLEIENQGYRRSLEEKVRQQADRIRAGYLNAIKALVYALEARDEYTSGHSQRVSELAVVIARELGLDDESVEKIRLAGLIHDIGKIGVKEKILHKSGKLTEKEYQHVMAHCEIGERILTPIIDDAEILEMVRYHHTTTQDAPVSLNTAVLMLADAFDAMTSDRPYRKALPVREALKEIKRGEGKQFDTAVVAAFQRALKSEVVSGVKNK
jgi:response regulator RpfG family c-di-GMP phosphodiesterase